MKALRNKLYSQIEKLERKLKEFDTDQYGFSSDPESLAIRNEISDLETEISKTWAIN